MVALIGNGQEINTGEAGLAEWGRVIAADPRWRAVAAPRVLQAAEPVQRLAEGHPAWLEIDDDLDLTVPMRSVREPPAPLGGRVLRGDAEAARRSPRRRRPAILRHPRPRRVEGRAARSLPRSAAGRAGGLCRRPAAAGRRPRRAGARGGGLVPDRWPDIRGAEALETFATEYDCQGLELDVVGLAWGGDFIRSNGLWSPALRRRPLAERAEREERLLSATPTACC